MILDRRILLAGLAATAVVPTAARCDGSICEVADLVSAYRLDTVRRFITTDERGGPWGLYELPGYGSQDIHRHVAKIAPDSPADAVLRHYLELQGTLEPAEA